RAACWLLWPLYPRLQPCPGGAKLIGCGKLPPVPRRQDMSAQDPNGADAKNSDDVRTGVVVDQQDREAEQEEPFGPGNPVAEPALESTCHAEHADRGGPEGQADLPPLAVEQQWRRVQEHEGYDEARQRVVEGYDAGLPPIGLGNAGGDDGNDCDRRRRAALDREVEQEKMSREGRKADRFHRRSSEQR